MQIMGMNWLALLALFWMVPVLQAQDRVTLARLNQDMQRLNHEVARLQLEVEALRRENAQLKQENQQLARQQAAFVQQYNTYVASAEARLGEVSAMEQRVRSGIMAEVRGLFKSLEGQLGSAGNAASSAPPPITFDDKFPKSGLEYIVEKGDTLSEIAREHDSRVIWIQKANKISDPTKIRVGHKLFVPQEN